MNKTLKETLSKLSVESREGGDRLVSYFVPAVLHEGGIHPYYIMFRIYASLLLRLRDQQLAELYNHFILEILALQFSIKSIPCAIRETQWTSNSTNIPLFGPSGSENA